MNLDVTDQSATARSDLALSCPNGALSLQSFASLEAPMRWERQRAPSSCADPTPPAPGLTAAHNKDPCREAPLVLVDLIGRYRAP